MKILICPIVLAEAGHRREDGCHISTGFAEVPSRKDASTNLWCMLLQSMGTSRANIEQAYRPHSGVEWHFACSMRSKWRHRAGVSALQPPGTPLALLNDLFKVFRQAFISYFIGLSLLYEHKNNNNRCCSVRFSLQPKVRNGQLH